MATVTGSMAFQARDRALRASAWCGASGQHLLGQFDHFAPAASIGGFVQTDEQASEAIAVLLQIDGELLQHGRPIVQPTTDALDGVQGQGELAALGQLAGLQPIARRLLQHLQLRRTHPALAQTGDGLVGPPCLAGVQQRPHLGESQPRQGLAQALDALFRRLQLLGQDQVAPGALGVIELELAFAVLDVLAGELGEKSTDGAMIAEDGLGQQTMGLFSAPLLEGFARLPDCQPCQAEHFSLLISIPRAEGARLRTDGLPQGGRPPLGVQVSKLPEREASAP